MSHFSWDTHFKQSIHLDEEWLLWLSLYSFGHWSNYFDLCRTLHALNVISSYILCILHFFVCIAFVLILLLCFSFVWVKIQNHIKSEKFKKFDRIYLSTYHMWVWPSIFVLMACAFASITCSLCTSIFVGKILTSMCDCCKSIFKLVTND